jgi:hypothetical protein
MVSEKTLIDPAQLKTIDNGGKMCNDKITKGQGTDVSINFQ